jgi:hypothetical protein
MSDNKREFALDADAQRRLEHISGPMRERLFELYQHAMRNEHDPEFLARRKREEQAKAGEDLQHLQSMTQKALSGVYGFQSKECADQITGGGRDRSLATMLRLRRELQKIPGRKSG